ncbi:hypothetical protein HK104_003288 [Borealophlyctis nickersoniae]|nr:hypothetical protein HK104_003288 [Borealophlyctis nickersoniae]
MSAPSTTVDLSDLRQLFSFYTLSPDALYRRPVDPDSHLVAIQDKCKDLFSRDYVIGTVPNANGELCGSYPLELLVIEKERKRKRRSGSTGEVQTCGMHAGGGVGNGAATCSAEARSGDASCTKGVHDSDDVTADRCSANQDAGGSLTQSQASRVDQFEESSFSLWDKSLPRVSNPYSNGTSNAFSNPAPRRGSSASITTYQPTPDEDLDDSMGMHFLFDEDLERPFDAERTAMEEATRALERVTLWNGYMGQNGLGSAERTDGSFGTRSTASAYTPCVDSGFSNGKQSQLKESEMDGGSLSSSPPVNNTKSLARLFKKSRFSRVRSRFVVPVIYCRGKNICRSSTLSHEAEVLLNTLNEKTRKFWYGADGGLDSTGDSAEDVTIMEKNRKADIEIMKELRIKHIMDLMVEGRKVKYGLTVTSSEKVDSQNRYTKAGFGIFSVPYPGVEFFRKFKANSYCARQLRFDWAQAFADAELSIPIEELPDEMAVLEWEKYKTWDLIMLTQNYLKLFLRYIAAPGEGNSPGLLIHCISGWDRTPLFISLLRMSLWADGEVHASLNPLEILYLTIAPMIEIPVQLAIC